jgi:pimeloyl-ACP methyl ester carboxylesterase
MNWGDKKPWLPKFQRLLARIDELSEQNQPVALVGVSAGASAVINAYAARKDKVAGVVCIAGKINRPEAIDHRYYVNNISFVTSAHDCVQALQTLTASDRARILSRYAVLDERVTRQDSLVPGAHNRLSPTIGHVPTIAAQLILGAPSFLRFLKRQLAGSHYS